MSTVAEAPQARPPEPPEEPDAVERPDVVAVENPTIDRIASAIVAIVPFLALIAGAILAWNRILHWSDLVIFAIMYVATGLGITVGFHRLLTHRSFKTYPAVRFVFAALGSMAIEGPVIEWVANHRQHHTFSDQEGDPHSPHLHGHGFRGALRGLVHAHIGWVFTDTEVANEQRYAPDLLADRAVKFVDTTFVFWALASLAIPFGLGYAMTGTIGGALTGLLWGGLVRLFFLHHVTFSINSLCHYFGAQRYETGDESRNLAWLALPSLGEAWHNNHHAFPTSAAHGLRRREVDLSALFIRGLERVGLAWDVVRVSPQRRQAKSRHAQPR